MPKRMLMIDDDVAITELVGQHFAQRGWEFAAARTNREGYAQALARKPTVVLLDLKLPDGDSWGLLSKLKSTDELKGVAVFMLSGAQIRPEDKVSGLTLGADDYIAKPFDMDILAAKIDALMRWMG